MKRTKVKPTLPTCLLLTTRVNNDFGGSSSFGISLTVKLACKFLHEDGTPRNGIEHGYADLVFTAYIYARDSDHGMSGFELYVDNLHGDMRQLEKTFEMSKVLQRIASKACAAGYQTTAGYAGSIARALKVPVLEYKAPHNRAQDYSACEYVKHDANGISWRIAELARDHAKEYAHTVSGVA